MRAASRTLSLVASTAACSAALAGCGGEESAPAEPRIARAVAEPLAARADRVASRLAAGDACGAKREADALLDEAVAAVNRGDVPRPLREELLSTAEDVAGRIECAPPPPPEQQPGPPDDDDDEDADGDDEAGDDEDDGERKGKGNGRGKGKRK